LETVELKVEERVAWITLNRPEALNALTLQLGRDLTAVVDRVAGDAGVRAVVITGAGRGFSSGADLRDGLTPGDAGRLDLGSPLRETFHPLVLRLRTLEKPVIAAVNGGAVGIGCSLALSADIVIAAESAYFLLAFANIGLGLDGGASAFLVSRVGHARASEMAMLAERIGAAKALDWGLVNRVAADGELLVVAAEVAAKLAAGPPGSYVAMKRTLNAATYANLQEVLDLEAALQQERGESADFMEGVAAFLEKRPAEFTGN
jgi:2-(1,2-epoxy-1,2-dihydrophenyl)acetyl-CoA isomerase